LLFAARITRLLHASDSGHAARHATPDSTESSRSEGATQFLVLELLEDRTPADRLAEGPFAVDDAPRIAIQMCDALDSAHRAGIV
jgi:hypothetical protein